MKLMPANNDKNYDKDAKIDTSQENADKNPDTITARMMISSLDANLASKSDGLHLTVDTDKSLVKLCVDLDRAFIRREFDVLAIHDIKEEMNKKGTAFSNECIVYEVINHKLAKLFLDGNPQMAAIFPCKIVVYEASAGKRCLSSMRPTKLVEFMGLTQLSATAKDIEDAIEAVIKDAVSFTR